MNTAEPSRYSTRQEIANATIHGIGALLSVAGTAILIVLASLHATAWHVVSFSVYGASLFMLFSASTLYHSFQSPRVKRILRIVDHCSIYLLIAGSYTPFLLVTLRGRWGWSLFGCVWGLTVVGIALKVFFTGRFRVLSTLIYLGMGWMVVVAIRPLLGLMPLGGFLWLLIGGIIYSSGTLFYLWRRLPYHHAVWHAFVLAASICHYFAMLLYVLPARAS